MKTIKLNGNWKVCDVASPEKIYEAIVPGDIHKDLIDAGIIENPYYADNSKKCSWVVEKDWKYIKEFTVSEIKEKTYIIFDGIDTISTIYLNGKKVAETNNMFMQYRIDVTDTISIGNNKLEIVLHSIRKELAKYPEEGYFGCFNVQRIFIRKAQCHFSWDWAPDFPATGIWKDVYLETRNDTYINDYKIKTELDGKITFFVNLPEDCEYGKEREVEIAVDGRVYRYKTIAQKNFYTIQIENGNLQEKNGYVLNITERANKLERKVKIHQEYHIKINDIPNELYLVCETPEKFEIKVNGQFLKEKPNGYFLDKSFQKTDISQYIIKGENTISFDCDFVQSDKFYENLKKARIFESEKNKLSYDIEIEAIYLLGDFAIKTNGKWEDIDKNAVRYIGNFEIEKQKDTLKPQNIEQQGYPFFAGEMILETELAITGKNPVLSLDIKGINAVRVRIGETEKVLLTDNRLPLSDFGVKGRAKVEITLINNLRNMLGPHHLKEGECHFVGPWCFFKEKCIWAENPEKDWNDNYCFVQVGIK